MRFGYRYDEDEGQIEVICGESKLTIDDTDRFVSNDLDGLCYLFKEIFDSDNFSRNDLEPVFHQIRGKLRELERNARESGTEK